MGAGEGSQEMKIVLGSLRGFCRAGGGFGELEEVLGGWIWFRGAERARQLGGVLLRSQILLRLGRGLALRELNSLDEGGLVEVIGVNRGRV